VVAARDGGSCRTRLSPKRRALLNFVRQLGGAFGVNLPAIFLERQTMFHADALTATQTSDNPATMTLLSKVAGSVQTANLPDTP
jgi:MFS transporter, DHA2 family, multidrug resistance protein